MSDAHWEFDVSPTTSEAYEAMVIVGRGLLSRRTKTLLIVRSILSGITVATDNSRWHSRWRDARMARGCTMNRFELALALEAPR